MSHRAPITADPSRPPWRSHSPSSLPLPSRIHRALTRFRRDGKGVTAIEFGLLALPFLATIVAIFEIAYVDFASEALQYAVSSASRQMLTGRLQSQNINTATQFVNTFVCPSLNRTLSSIDCSKLIVDIRTATSFVATDMSNSFYAGNQQKYCPGQPGQIVVVRVVYPLPTIFPLSLYNQFVGLENNVPGRTGWFHILMGSALFQEEPYTNTYTSLPTC